MQRMFYGEPLWAKPFSRYCGWKAVKLPALMEFVFLWDVINKQIISKRRPSQIISNVKKIKQEDKMWGCQVYFRSWDQKRPILCGSDILMKAWNDQRSWLHGALERRTLREEWTAGAKALSRTELGLHKEVQCARAQCRMLPKTVCVVRTLDFFQVVKEAEGKELGMCMWMVTGNRRIQKWGRGH